MKKQIFSHRFIQAAVSVLVFCFIFPSAALSATLRSALTDLLTIHPLVQKSKVEKEAATEGYKAARAEWFPTLDLTTHYGYENQDKNYTTDTELTSRYFHAKLTQTVWDFGAINADINAASNTVKMKEAALERRFQDTLLGGVKAILNLRKHQIVLQYARQSEANIKKQTELENARIESGLGLTTDLLQAKSQLAGAQTRRTEAEGNLRLAENRFRLIFGKDPDNVPLLKQLDKIIPLKKIPNTLKEVISLAIQQNPLIIEAQYSENAAEDTLKSTRASEFFPVITASTEYNDKRDYGGTAGDKNETIALLEMSYSFNTGLSGVNKVSVAQKTKEALRFQTERIKDKLEELARNAWNALETAKNKESHLKNQVNLVREYLRLARQEREYGNRSLLDVLNGETILINARSDSEAAQTDVIIANYELLHTMGALQLKSIP
ncbi:TolC family protein [Magnetococcales bacterium HHB-1]